ncbi:MAG: DNA polymerase [bacterium]|nr:DNA polymerase [bacterium]
MKTNPTSPKASKGKKRLILFDAHAIIHRAYHALPEFATSSGEPTGALYGLSAMLLKIIGDLKPDFMVACFDLPGPTHRHEVYDAYKAGRAKIDDNLIRQLERAKDVFAAFGIPIYSHSGFEADDIIGTIAHELSAKGGSASGGKKIEIIIASGDMDALQLVDGKKVQVYTLKKGINDTILYDEKKVTERFGFPPKLLVDYKGLRGDPSDNIVGVKGIGEKTATSLITTFGSVEDIYKALKKKDNSYKEAQISERIRNLLIENEEGALFSKTLATIRTDAPIHFVLPPEWKENLEINKLLDLFSQLEFRTMGERVKMLMGETSTTEAAAVHVVSEEEKELCLALWVIDSNFTNPTLEEVFRFTKTDNTEEAKKVIESELDKRKVRKVFEEIEKPIIEVVEEMNERGIKVDKKILKNLSSKYHQELERLEKAIWKEAGEEFNINSPKILSHILFDKLQLADKRQKKTPTGALSTKESELEKLKDKHPIIALVLEYRELAKLLSTYIDAIPPLLDKNSRLHSTFLQAGTTTGRMASNNPNLQNIPNKTLLGRVIRNAFVVEKGFKLVSLDYSQIELRIAAILSQDKKLIEIFKSGVDVHMGVAMRVFKVPKELVDKSMRTKAKAINFGILYGMGVNALKANLGVDRKEAQEFYNEYFETFTDLAKYLDKIKAEATRKGYAETLFGRRRYFVGLKSPLPYVRAQAERMAINAPMQGTQADLIKIAMKKIDEYIKSEKHEHDIHLVLQVHDELVYEIRDSLVNKAGRHFKQLMETVLPEAKTFDVPIVVEVEVGENWGEMRHI